ncbi:MAG: LysM domain-containing protein [Caldilineae bacterium]|nr:MAG: LysM domain-containing protein [Caldilineae bacterium]
MKRALFTGLVLALLLTLIGPALTVSAAPVQRSCRKIHIVKRGQTLSGIAWRYGVSLRALRRANNIKNVNIIYPRQRICIPGAKRPRPKPPVSSPTGYYPPPPQPGDPADTCGVPVVLGFGRIYTRYPQVAAGLGCPTAPEEGFAANDQRFRRGYVVQNTDAAEIYVLFDAGTLWEKQPDTWAEGDPVDNPALRPPRGWYQPTHGIGKMWRNVDNYSQRLGWARSPQHEVVATRQPFEHGMMIWTASQGIFVLYENGSWQHYN